MFENVMNQLRDAFGGFLPELLTALLVLVAGWILALIVAALVRGLLAQDIVNLAFGLLLGAVAVAAAIAFGIGGRELAGRQLRALGRHAGGGQALSGQT